ncbi:hypothetical protein BKA70DRAFT_170396 [Coprinopsis sp. MPI-PUGE-AT-0042]|nr:hypothetical protein BKA70DRAFT_170396 [Coprinopsis sp. MPI-PUGE-AT-0042]
MPNSTNEDLSDLLASSSPSAIYKVVASARSGNISAVTSLPLVLDTETGSHCFPDTLEIYFSFLNPSLVPSVHAIVHGDIAALDHAERGLHSLIGLQNLLQDVHSSHRPRVKQLKDTVINRVTQQLNGITTWFRFSHEPSFLSHPRLSGTCRSFYLELFCRFLVAIRGLSTALYDATWEKPGIQDLVVKVWLVQYGDINPPKATIWDEYPPCDYFLNVIDGHENDTILMCTIPATMREALRRGDIRSRIMDKLYHQLQSDGKLQTDRHVRLAETVLSRIRQLYTRNEGQQCSTAFGYQALFYLCKVILLLFGDEQSATNTARKGSPKSRPSKTQKMLYQAFYKAGYIELVTRTLVSVSNRAFRDKKQLIIKASPSHAITVKLLWMISCFLCPKQFPEPASHLKERYRSILNNGIIEAALNAAHIWKRSPPSFKEAHQKSDVLLIATRVVLFATLHSLCHPGLIRAAQRAFETISGESWEILHGAFVLEIGKVKDARPDSTHDHWASELGGLLDSWANLFANFKSSWQSTICDSQTHYRDRSSVPEGERHIRKCAECSSVVYCGRRCQRADWEERHRSICHARRIAQEEPEAYYAGNCSQRVRAWHQFFVQHTVCKSRWTKIIVETCSLASPVVSRMEFHTIPFKLSLMELKKYQPLFVSSNEALEESFRRDFLLWTPPRSTTGKNGSRLHFCLVEGVFAFDVPCLVALATVKLCICVPPAGSDDSITTICMDSISRIGTIPAGPAH